LKKVLFLITLALAATPFAANAEVFNIYGWQNWSYAYHDQSKGRNWGEISGNAANIGLSASVDTGLPGMKVNLQCESWALHNHWSGNGGWCTRNSKLGLAIDGMGEIMFATWLLPYNEAVAQWIDPFYDAGPTSHTSIMGGIGGSSIYHSPGIWHNARGDFGEGGAPRAGLRYAIGLDTGLNRRQEDIIQWFSPNWNGFKVRFAVTSGREDEAELSNGTDKAKGDPQIMSGSMVYEDGPLWLAATWQEHEDWTASRPGGLQGTMTGSDTESWRLAGRYIADMGNGMSVQIAVMYEDLEYEFNNVSSFDDALGAFYLSNSMNYGMPSMDEVTAEKSLSLLHDTFDANDDMYLLGDVSSYNIDELEMVAKMVGSSPSSDFGPRYKTLYELYMQRPFEDDEGDGGKTAAEKKENWLKERLGKRRELNVAHDSIKQLRDTGMDEGLEKSFLDILALSEDQYKELVEKATTMARNTTTKGTDVRIEREAWMISGKIKFGGPVDFRFSYMDADDLEVSCGASLCNGDWQDTDADSWNVGLFYTTPAGTEFRVTYTELNNNTNSSYALGVTGAGYGSVGNDIEMFSVGVVQWFD